MDRGGFSLAIAFSDIESGIPYLFVFHMETLTSGYLFNHRGIGPTSKLLLENVTFVNDLTESKRGRMLSSLPARLHAWSSNVFST